MGRTEVDPSLLYVPKEETLEVAPRFQALRIGIPRETSFQENRVPLVPQDVARLVSLGHEIVVETAAGQAAHFQDRDFSEAGARIAFSAEEIFRCDMVLKVSPPTHAELSLLKPGQLIISAVQLGNHYADILQELIKRKVSAVAINFIKDDDDVYPIVRSMSEIAGVGAILVAAEYLSTASGGKGLVLGGVTGLPPAEVVIIGAGTVGEFAARAALGLGATVKVFDNSIHKLRRFQTDIGRRVFTSVLNENVLRECLRRADVAIGCLRPRHGRTPCVVPESMVSEMKVGSVIVDISIDQGGVFETSRVTDHNHPVFRKYGVVHYCVPNIASRMAHTASYALSSVLTPILDKMGEVGGFIPYLKKNKGFRQAVYMYNGMLTNRYFAEMFNMQYKDLELLLLAL
ncbi:MAG: alanine dehydrogenase [Flavobacteriales bacterium]|nr:alanine dehydrogenase [Flavobacteriales bacterium]MCX7767512.1 alanine dehydrogenase [Flavobacteriales bacterium]MDW8409647.1 alanine dehydrogenase [Flavobacteriales bacterium]